MRNIFAFAFCLWLSSFVPAQADMPGTPPLDSRMRTLMYDANDIFTILTRYGYQTNIEFDRNEEIETISVGDRSLWQIVPAGNRLFIRPMADNVSTNMTIITNKRSYQFDLKSTGANDSDKNVIYVARFTYPSPNAAVAAPMAPTSPTAPIMSVTVAPPPPPPTGGPVALSSAPEERPMMTPPAPPKPAPSPLGSNLLVPKDKRNYAYTYSGSDSAAPLEVFDDGKNTYVRYANMARTAPKFYAMETNGNDRQLFFDTREGYYVIPEVVERLALMSNSEVVYLYNESLHTKITIK